MTAAEKFAMCMAEAGWPIGNVSLVGDCFLLPGPSQAQTLPGFWAAVWKAQELVLGVPPEPSVCLSCFVAFKQGDWPLANFHVPCEHVEVSA